MVSDIELRHLRYFVAVAEELHFGRAADRLHIAQPPLSQQIRKLEEIVGHPLFTRTSRAVRLTSAGEVLLERALRTLHTVQEDLEEVRSVGRGEVGVLRIGFVGSAMLTSFPVMLGQYRLRYPKLNLHLHEFYTAGVMRALNDGVVDVGILRDGGSSTDLVVEELLAEPFIAVVPASHRLRARNSISLRELRDDPFVFFPESASQLAYDRAISVCEENGFRPRIVQVAPQWPTILRLVGAGLGVTIAPACVRGLAVPDIACLKLQGSGVRSTVELAFRVGETRPVVQTFCRIAREFLSAQRQPPSPTKSARPAPR